MAFQKEGKRGVSRAAAVNDNVGRGAYFYLATLMNSISCLNLTSGGVVKYNNVHEFMTIRKTCFLISQFKIVVNYIN